MRYKNDKPWNTKPMKFKKLDTKNMRCKFQTSTKKNIYNDISRPKKQKPKKKHTHKKRHVFWFGCLRGICSVYELFCIFFFKTRRRSEKTIKCMWRIYERKENRESKVEDEHKVLKKKKIGEKKKEKKHTHTHAHKKRHVFWFSKNEEWREKCLESICSVYEIFYVFLRTRGRS